MRVETRMFLEYCWVFNKIKYEATLSPYLRQIQRKSNNAKTDDQEKHITNVDIHAGIIEIVKKYYD